jgi:hypothetical protein
MTTQVIITLDVPALPLDEYARRTGQKFNTCKQQVKEGKLPILQEKKGAKIYVNMVAMYKTCNEAAGWNMKVPSNAYSL